MQNSSQVSAGLRESYRLYTASAWRATAAEQQRELASGSH